MRRGGSWRHVRFYTGEADLWNYSFSLDVWRVRGEQVHLSPLSMSLIVPKEKISSYGGFSGMFRNQKVVHFKARLYQHESGYYQGLFVEWVGPTEEDAELNELYSQLKTPVYFQVPGTEVSLLSTRYSWKAAMTLESWVGFRTLAHYATSLESERDVSLRGEVQLGVAKPEGSFQTLADRHIPPTDATIEGVKYLLANEQSIAQDVLMSIFEQYPLWQADYGGDLVWMPDLTTPDDLRKLIRLLGVGVGANADDGKVSISFDLTSAWDPEHGFGAVWYDGRIVAVGIATRWMSPCCNLQMRSNVA